MCSHEGRCLQVFLPTAREGNVFRSVCPSVCQRRVGGREDDLPKGGLPRGGSGLLTGRSTDRASAKRGFCICLRGGQTPLVVTSSCGHCRGRYASYWNAFLCTLLLAMEDEDHESQGTLGII